MSQSTHSHVRWLDELGDDEVAFAGRKALNLARLRQAGFNVPNGFIVNAAFRADKEYKSTSAGFPRKVRDEILGSQLFKPGGIWGEPGFGALNGVGVSSGLAQGPVHILKTIEDAVDLREGEILVLPSLDPTWTAAFAKAAGLIAERGAVLSHGAILAREFNLPAVVNIANATSTLTDGKRVSINGSTGTVQLLNNASS